MCQELYVLVAAYMLWKSLLVIITITANIYRVGKMCQSSMLGALRVYPTESCYKPRD